MEFTYQGWNDIIYLCSLCLQKAFVITPKYNSLFSSPFYFTIFSNQSKFFNLLFIFTTDLWNIRTQKFWITLWTYIILLLLERYWFKFPFPSLSPSSFVRKVINRFILSFKFFSSHANIGYETSIRIDFCKKKVLYCPLYTGKHPISEDKFVPMC